MNKYYINCQLSKKQLLKYERLRNQQLDANPLLLGNHTCKKGCELISFVFHIRLETKVANDLSRHFYNIFFPFQVTLLIIWLLIFIIFFDWILSRIQKYFEINQQRLSLGVLIKRCYENMQQIYRRTPIPKFNFNKVVSNFIETTLYHECFHVNLLHIFRTPFPENKSEGLLLNEAN